MKILSYLSVVNIEFSEKWIKICLHRTNENMQRRNEIANHIYYLVNLTRWQYFLQDIYNPQSCNV